MNDEAPPGPTRTPSATTSTCPPTSACTSFQKLPWLTDAAALAARRPDVAIVGAPFDDGVSHRPGARFGPRAIRAGDLPRRRHQLAPARDRAVRLARRGGRRRRARDADNIERGHAVIERKVLEVAAPARSRSCSAATTRSPSRPPPRWREPSPRAGSASSTSTPTPTPPTRPGATSAPTARRCAA